jgi:type II secretory ATPase GspE/PulE/Tfp pilus assembly ATPase PilB-like protein
MEEFVPPIDITPAGDSAQLQEAALEAVKPSKGFPSVCRLLVDLILRESFTSVLDFTPKSVAIRYHMDGLWHAGAPMDRESGDFLLATLKRIAGLDYRERRKRQEGKFTTLYSKTRQTFRIVSQGMQTGERVAIYLDWKRPPLETLDQLGMRASMQRQLSEVLSSSKIGITFVTAIPGEGYTSFWRAVLTHCDRLTRDYYVIEEVNQVEPEVINIFSVPFDRSKGEDAMSPIPQLLLRQPDVITFNELPDGKTIDSVVSLSNQHQMPSLIRAPGKHCLDALLRLVALKPNVEEFANRLEAIVAMRLVRKLCETCRIPFRPAPALMQKLQLPPGRIGELYKPNVFKPGTLDENEKEILPCKKCQGIGFRGRTGIFELLTVTEPLRQALAKRTKLDSLMALAEANHHISMQQEGIVLVAKGVTSIDELQRVLKT